MTNPPPVTIAAIATPPGRGAIGIVRVSGVDASNIANALLGTTPLARQARWCDFRARSGEVIDRGIAIYFPGPNSYTGEDTLELQAHGGAAVLRMLLEEVCALGAEHARPGEFTERAFHNGKLDLLQAESVAALIDAASSQAARAAARACSGAFSTAVQAVSTRLRAARVLLEAGIDFGDDVADGLDEAHQVLREAGAALTLLLRDAEAGARLATGLDVAIVGAPNSGKSTLLNQLCGEDRAIVTPIAGTTRDVLSVDVVIEGIAFRLHDTAGLRDSDDPIESEGIRRARKRLAEADIVLHVQVAGDPCGQECVEPFQLAYGQRYLRVRNKIDLAGEKAAREGQADGLVVGMSALCGDGLDLLRQALWEVAGGTAVSDAPFTARARHLTALRGVAQRVDAALVQMAEGAVELCCEELRAANQLLAEMTGEWTTEDLLGAVFSTFCIGK